MTQNKLKMVMSIVGGILTISLLGCGSRNHYESSQEVEEDMAAIHEVIKQSQGKDTQQIQLKEEADSTVCTTSSGLNIEAGDFYFYEIQKKDRYEAYAKENPTLSIEEIVLRVNMDLDIPFYEKVEKVEIVDETPMLVNKYNQLSENYIPKELTQIEGNYMATKDTAEAYQQLAEAASEAGYDIRVASAYRSYKYQSYLYQRYLEQDPQEIVNTYSARPGFSEHQTGRAIDLETSTMPMEQFGETKAYTWIKAHAYEYGFILRYPKEAEEITGYMYEPWHITYVGKDVATRMKEAEIETLEEYWVKYVNHRADA